jgi:hypothetical protein
MEFSGAVKILGFDSFEILKSHAGGYHVSHACTSKSAGTDAYTS